MELWINLNIIYLEYALYIGVYWIVTRTVPYRRKWSTISDELFGARVYVPVWEVFFKQSSVPLKY